MKLFSIDTYTLRCNHRAKSATTCNLSSSASGIERIDYVNDLSRVDVNVNAYIIAEN